MSTEVEEFNGTPARPLDRAELKDKFITLTRARYGAAAAELFERLQGLENRPNSAGSGMRVVHRLNRAALFGVPFRPGLHAQCDRHCSHCGTRSPCATETLPVQCRTSIQSSVNGRRRNVAQTKFIEIA